MHTLLQLLQGGAKELLSCGCVVYRFSLLYPIIVLYTHNVIMHACTTIHIIVYVVWYSSPICLSYILADSTYIIIDLYLVCSITTLKVCVCIIQFCCIKYRLTLCQGLINSHSLIIKINVMRALRGVEHNLNTLCK